MSLNAALSLFLEEYPRAAQEPLTGHPLAEFVRNEIPEQVRSVLGANDRYLIHGSVGQGNWARVPWLAIFDRLITETARRGFYVVYLVREDFSGVFLSLNQGVTDVRERYGAEARHALEVRAQDLLAQLGNFGSNFRGGPIDLQVSGGSTLGAFYEVGSILSKFYPLESLPEDEILNSDLVELMELYSALSSRAVLVQGVSPQEDDEQNTPGVEDLTRLREHKRIERNQRLSRAAKRSLGYTCQVCGFNFEARYGEIGRDFIEAHHLVPLSDLRGQRVLLRPDRDFAVLCSNCHKMIHRSDLVHDPEGFRRRYLEDEGEQ